jgi:DNA-binding LacI/PurR family transcriptional regulator
MTIMPAAHEPRDPDPGPTSPRRRAIALIREWIRAGRYGSGQALPAERELAKAIAVARVTVRSALAELVREGLLEASFRRQHRVAGLASGGLMSRTVAVLSKHHQKDHARRGYDLAIQLDTSRLLEQAGLHVLNLNPQTLLDGGLAHLLSQRPRAVLVTYDVSESEVGPDLIAACAEARIPVAAYGYSPALRRCDVVTCDQEAGSHALTRWLLQRGRRRILRLWRVRGDSHWLRQRDAGHERALREAGIAALPPVVVHGLPDGITDQAVWERTVRAIAGHLPEHLCGPTPIDAIMVASDPHTNQVAAALRLFGRVPNEDVDIVGYDHTWSDEPSRIWEATGPLATVDKRCERICQELAALVLDRIDGRLPEAPQRRVVEGQFVALGDPQPQRATG